MVTNVAKVDRLSEDRCSISGICDFDCRCKKNEHVATNENSDKIFSNKKDKANANFEKKRCSQRQFKGKHSLKCMYFNARSLVNKIEELELYIKEEELDIIAVTETWLTEEILTSEYSVQGYTLIRRDRKDLLKSKGGGVAFYVKDDINVLERDDIKEKHFPETLWCEIEVKSEKTVLGVLYRAPDCLTINNEAMYSLINKVGKENVVIMGDFNFPELKWSARSNTLHEHPFITCINDNFLEQMVDKPTRGENVLDLILCSDTSFV